jgi:hypothetical protein
MSQIQKRVFTCLILLGTLYFCLMIWPNSKGAKDSTMVSIFEPDEAAQLPHVMRMVIPASTPKASFRNFFYYQHYYYGFPFYFSSAVFALLPVKYLVGLGSTTINMLAMRQVIGVLPMIIAVIVLVYVQTRFKHMLASVTTFLFLLTIPAVFQNSTWWHPDSLTLLFVALTFFFLDRDELNFGRKFYLAAATCGLATGTKLLGLFFFLAIPVYLIIGIAQRRLTIRQALIKALLFLVIMFVTFIAVNPFLLNPEQRYRAYQIQSKQAESMSKGWNVLYDRGPVAWYPMIETNYGHIAFILLAVSACIMSIVRNHKHIINILILLFVVPFITYVFLVIVIKPTHFLLPASLPLYSTLAGIFWILPRPTLTKLSFKSLSSQAKTLMTFLATLIIIFYQVTFNFQRDIIHYSDAINKENANQEIQFYNVLVNEYLHLLPDDKVFTAFRDVRIYLPATDIMNVTVRTKMATYPIIEAGNYDLVLMWNQRALDYTQAGVIENAVDRAEMEQAYKFYSDIRQKKLNGYVLLYDTSCCSAFIREKLYDRYLTK